MARSNDTIDIGSEPGEVEVRVKLTVVGGPDVGLEAPLAGVFEIGADETCQLPLTDSTVSRHHARVTLDNGAIVIVDRGSRNGTFIGESRIREAEIPVGGVFRVGKTTIAVQPRWRIREVPPSASRSFGELYGESVAMREVFALLERTARTDVTVLVEGESGTGKELAARSIHAASPRSKQPYVVFDCSAVPPNLAESELFGHRRGAFSGATSDRAGAFQRAHGGTLCLDEIGELPLDLQPKLLRVLENREVRPIGEDKPRSVDVRIIASTNRDLAAEAERGRFRSDLLYRLAVVSVRLPPLRARPMDIPGLVDRLLRNKLPPEDHVSGPNLTRLMAYAWPGNVRELRNALTRAVTLGTKPDGTASTFGGLVFDLGPASATALTIGMEFPGVADALPYKEAKAQLIESFDRAYVASLLKRHPNSVVEAARAAGLSRKHVYELMRRAFGREPPEEDDP